MKPFIGVVVVSFNSAAELPSCLEALISAHGVARVIVVDNASTDGSREIVARFADHRIELMACAENTGFAGGCNRGFAALADECGIVAFVNPDVTVTPGCLRLAADTLDADRFRELTRGGDLARVLAGIHAAIDVGLEVKLRIEHLRRDVALTAG